MLIQEVSCSKLMSQREEDLVSAREEMSSTLELQPRSQVESQAIHLDWGDVFEGAFSEALKVRTHTASATRDNTES